MNRTRKSVRPCIVSTSLGAANASRRKTMNNHITQKICIFVEHIINVMAAKKAIGILRSFFKEQEKDNRARVATDDETAIEEVVGTPNPAIAEAKRRKVVITVAQGDTIYKIGADDTREMVGKVAAEDVRLSKRRFSLQ